MKAVGHKKKKKKGKRNTQAKHPKTGQSSITSAFYVNYCNFFDLIWLKYYTMSVCTIRCKKIIPIQKYIYVINNF